MLGPSTCSGKAGNNHGLHNNVLVVELCAANGKPDIYFSVLLLTWNIIQVKVLRATN